MSKQLERGGQVIVKDPEGGSTVVGRSAASDSTSHKTVVKGASAIKEHDTQTVGDMHGGAPYLPEDKFDLSPLEAEDRYGVVKLPVVADEAWVAPIPNFSRKNTRAEKWVLVNYRGNNGNGTMTFINTFDGFAGVSFKQDATTIPLNPRKFREKTGEHKRVAVDDCPVACTHEEWEAHQQGTGELVSTSLVSPSEESQAEQIVPGANLNTTGDTGLVGPENETGK